MAEPFKPAMELPLCLLTHYERWLLGFNAHHYRHAQTPHELFLTAMTTSTNTAIAKSVMSKSDY